MKYNYWSPTPKKFRKFGDALLASGTAVTSLAIINDHKVIAITALIMMVVGKFLTNFFKEDAGNQDQGAA